MKRLELPLDVFTIRALSVGDQVAIEGTIFTAHGASQKHLHDGEPVPFDATGSLLYHCGPIGRKRGKKWKAQVASPDASLPHEHTLGEAFGRLGVRGIIGRGAMGQRTIAACRRHGACYFHTIGGAGLALARTIKEVRAVHLTDKYPDSEAIWELEVERFPAVVTIDAFGRSLHDLVRDGSQRRVVTFHD